MNKKEREKQYWDNHFNRVITETEKRIGATKAESNHNP